MTSSRREIHENQVLLSCINFFDIIGFRHRGQFIPQHVFRIDTTTNSINILRKEYPAKRTLLVNSCEEISLSWSPLMRIPAKHHFRVMCGQTEFRKASVFL